MVDFDRLKVRFRQFGGWRLVTEYVRMGVLWTGMKEVVRCAVKGRSMKAVYPVVTGKVDEILLKKYCSDLKERVEVYLTRTEQAEKKVKTHIWWCWLQGEEAAPDMAKSCLAALRRDFTDCEIVVITSDNRSEWLTLPEYIVEKYKKGIIPHALFSDLLRIELLAEHGGVWIDSTVLWTGGAEDLNVRTPHIPSWNDIVSAEVFVFQYTQPGHPWSGNISNWFIGAQEGHPFIMVLRDLLFNYWKDYDCVVEYYIFHLYFAEVAKAMPEVIDRMPYGWSIPCIELGRHLAAPYNEEQWKRFSSKILWHKMNYRMVNEQMKADTSNIYNHIIAKH